MTKEEIIKAILNRISDPYTDSEEDIAFCDPIELPYATEWLAELRQEDIDNANDGEFRMPNAATPELLMEAFNCRVSLAKREVTIERLTDYLAERGDVALYANCCPEPRTFGPMLCPLDHWYNLSSTSGFPFGYGDKLTCLDVIELIDIGRNSRDTCDFTEEYIWYDSDKKTLHTTSDPYHDGTFNVEAFAEYAIDNSEVMSEIIGDMDPKEQKYVFKYMPNLCKEDC